jgi:O-methyltransferase
VKRADRICESDPDSVASITVREAEYYSRWIPPHPLFTPWVGHPSFTKYAYGTELNSLVSPERRYLLLALALHAAHLEGNFAECGVFRGGTALMLARVIAETTEKKLRLFDSFAGLSAEDNRYDNHYKKGDFVAPRAHLESLLAAHSTRIEIREGWIPDTFIGLESERFALAHIDVDLFQPTLDSCQFFYHRMTSGGVLLFDDYGFPACRGEKEAVDLFFSDKPEPVITLPSGQGLVMKLP